MSAAAVTTREAWDIPDEELGNVTMREKPQPTGNKERRRVQPKDVTPQWTEAVEIGNMSPGLEAAVRTVLKLSALKAGWDGYRSPALGQPAVEGALSVLGILEGLALPKPHVSPVPGGGIQIEWEKAGKELELEFGRTGTLTYLKTDPESDEEGTLTAEHRHKLWSLLVWLSE
jgi:hypothetical protein